MTLPLFVYGTLAPDGPEAAARDGWQPDLVRGRLFDLGPYPALIDCGDPTADWVEGYTRPIAEELLVGSLDAYEGVAEGLYRRETVTTRSGQVAWIYVYARPLPASARGPMPRWTGRRGGPRLADTDLTFSVSRTDPT
ncbi:MAG: gamma-glutamylcyclotransferase [Isosphaeraceae bacterium]